MSNLPEPYSIRTIGPGSYELWDRFVFSAQGGTVFHTSAWADLIKTVFNRPFRIEGLFKNEQLQAGMLFWPKKNLGIHSIPQAPVTTYQGLLWAEPASDKPSSATAAYQKIHDLFLARLQQEFSLIDIPLHPAAEDMRPWQWHGFSARPAYTYTFNILPFDTLKGQFSQALRRKFNRSEQENLAVAESQDFRPLLHFVRDSYAFHRITPPVSPGKMESLFAAVTQSGIGRIFYLQKNKKPVAGLMILEDRQRVYAYFSGIDAGARQHNYTEYLHAKILQSDRFNGKMFDFLGSNTPELEQFKRSFGGRSQLYFRVRYQKNFWIRALFALRTKQHRLQRSLIGSKQ